MRRTSSESADRHSGSFAGLVLAVPVIGDRLGQSQTILVHQDEAANGCAEGCFAHQLGKVDRKVDHRLKQGLRMKFDEIRAYLDAPPSI